ncbi:MAG: hypothetical protein RBG1_1C00001G0612 [candidate division Zixibacteria bacterium RBG-1]|nr:MAG: hypothetical protein RBG1_1C00001G0612 [candidate division Zixibacteria bacterium RBG-1]OGC85851.1 MAG: iron-binding protein [candidate division Zixibacteria bacterium RBG_19FT_COMBO_42_43]
MANIKITVSQNGPLRIEGEINICDAQGNTYGLAGRTMISLCRCGNSNNKPFCDGTHNKIGFQHEPTAFELPPMKPKV